MKKSTDISRPSKACILTFGCQMNVHDSERMGSILEKNGFVMSESYEDCGVIILNTCSVRGKPEEKVSSMLQQVRSLKAKDPSVVIAVAGCVAQQKGEQIIRSFPFVDVVIGPDGIDKLLGYINQVRSRRSNTVDTDFIDEISYSNTLLTSTGMNKAHAYVTAMKGCNNFCSYCIVPYVRGRERSRSISEVTEDVRSLVDQGVTAITLLGQNIARFGLENKEALPGLLRSVGAIKGLKRLSFFTSHPRDFTDEMIRCYDEVPALTPMIHLPCQHGSNKILKAMNRGYTREQYLAIIDKLRRLRNWEDMAITTDVILGFPGEEEQDFEDLMSLLNEVRYDNSFSFVYSPRPGTKAYDVYGNSVDPKLRKVYTDRLMKYQDRQKEIAMEKHRRLLGSTMEILVEGASSKDPKRLTGRTSSWKVVNFDSSHKQSIDTGSYVMVKIVKVHPTHLKGELLND